MSVFKDFPGLENLEKLFQDFQGPARAVGYVDQRRPMGFMAREELHIVSS